MKSKNLTFPYNILILFIIITSLFVGLIPAFSENIKTVKATSPIIDRYITVNSSSRNFNDSITVKYTMKRNYTISKSAPISIGYKFPYKHRLGTDFHKSREINYNKGNHTLTIPKPDYNLVGTLTLSIELWSRYTESRYISHFFNAPTSITVKYHTVSRGEEGDSLLMYSTAPRLYLTFTL